MKQKFHLTSLAKALANNEFEYYYQPVISLFTGKICGLESLIRWPQADGSIVCPDQFIPLAEETGFITEITQLMLPKVVQGLEKLNIIDNSLFVSLNVSAKDFKDDEFLDAIIKSTSGKLSIIENLAIEITETSFLPSDKNTQKILHELNSMGISIILDDFGEGFTTFSTLTHLPLKAIKIALSVTQRAPTSRNGFRLFRHLVSLAHQLGFEIIAEGVETEEMHSIITSTGCTHAQGYYYGRPMPLDNVIELLKENFVWSENPFGLEHLAQFDHIDFRRDIIRSTLMIFKHQDKAIRERVLARLPNLTPQNCLFGKWFVQIKDLNTHNPLIEKIEIEHEQFHFIANALLDKALSGGSWDELDTLIIEFSDKSKSITNMVHDLDIEKLQDHFRL